MITRAGRRSNDDWSGWPLMALAPLALAALALAGCAAPTTTSQRQVFELGQLNPSGTPVTSPQLFVPGGGPVPITNWRNAGATGDQLRAVIYVGQCTTWDSIDDHVAFLRAQGVAVVLPAYSGQTCVIAEYPSVQVQRQISYSVSVLREIPWIDKEHIFLIGHGVGADSVVNYPDEGVFAGIMGLAAACPFGQQSHTPLITFRALDDLVLQNRKTFCSEEDSQSTMHVDFRGGDHKMFLARAGSNEGRQRIGATVVAFLRQGMEPAATVAETELSRADETPEPEADVQAVASPPAEAQAEAEAPANTPEPAAPEPASPEPVEQAADPAPPRPATPPAPAPQVAPRSSEVIDIPTLALPPGRF